MPNPSENIEKLLKDASMRSSHPEGHLLLVAETCLEPRSPEPLPPGASKKMPETVAKAAITVVTQMMRRYGLRASGVCADAKVANARNEYTAFHLTAPEMDAAGTPKKPLKPGRRIHRGLAPYVRMVRQIAAKAGVPEADLFQELGSAVSGYLAPFAASDRTPLELLAEDTGLLARYFGKARDGSDGEPLDVRRYFSDASRMGVEFSPVQGRMVPAPDEPYPHHDFGHAPCVPLLARTVAVGRVRCNMFDETMEGEVFAVPLGEMRAEVFEVVFLSVVPDGRGLRTVLYAEPWTATFGEVGPHARRPWGEGGLTDVVRGAPFVCELDIRRDGERHAVCFDDEALRFTCADYERHVRELLREAAEAEREDRDARDFYAALDFVRRIDVGEDGLRTVLGRAGEEKWRSLLGFFPDAPAFASSFALPRLAQMRGGETTDALADRLAEALLGDGQLIVKRLTEAATLRARAMEAFMSERLDGERLRRDRFRRLMRS